jgi:hypothetical protein
VKKGRKRLLLLGGLIPIGVLVVACILFVSYSRKGPFAVDSMDEIPCASRVLGGMQVSSSLEYVHVRKYRNDEFYVRGVTSRQAIDGLKNRNPGWYLYNKGEYKALGQDMLEAVEAFSGTESASWLSDCLLLTGFADDETFVVVAFDTVSGVFYARLNMTGFLNRRE